MSEMKLHIGCGADLKPGYINIDEFSDKADIKMALQDLNYPTETIDCIEGYMVLEHLNPDDALAFIKNSYRMLKKGGVLILEVPDLEKVSRLTLVFTNDPAYLRNGAFGLRGFFGEPTDHMQTGDYHKWGYTPSLAKKLLQDGGFTQIKISDGFSHCYPLRDLRMDAQK